VPNVFKGYCAVLVNNTSFFINNEFVYKLWFLCSNCIVVFVLIHFLRFVLKTSCVSDFILLCSTHERPLNGSLWVFMKNAVWNYFVEKHEQLE
jgi:hypothetical protein